MIEDFRDLLEQLVAADVRFLVVGAHALAVHGVPRATGDLDVWVRPDPENAKCVVTALGTFGAPTDALGISEHDFVRPDVVAQFGLPPYRVDLMTSISGVDFDVAWNARIEGNVEGVLVPVLGLEAFVQNKRASGRKKDLADLESLDRD
ncbi:MAG TPA: hypothetical protein VHV78_01605 [Gemmatimonadaceae bacterium]|nr:hypothetical protein [Gemmatimonadaceae bacterium]